MQRLLFVSFLLLVLVSCNKDVQPNAETIINKAIEVSGGNLIATATIDFDFRDKHYKAIRNNGLFQLEREFKDSIYDIKDVYTNTDFTRFVNNEAVIVHDTMAAKYISSVNSVHYFSVLPYGLDAKAVNRKYLEDVNVKGKKYHKIKVTFNQEGGGEDFEDVFVYWINVDTQKIEYLAYSYIEDDDIGLRFREAYNERYISGIRFVDYNNYKPNNNNEKLIDLDSLFENNELKLLSKIENKSIKVSL